MVSERGPDRRGQVSAVDCGQYGGVEPGERKPVGRTFCNVWGADGHVDHHVHGIDRGHLDDVHDTTLLDSAGGLVDPGVGTVDESAGESLPSRGESRITKASSVSASVRYSAVTARPRRRPSSGASAYRTTTAAR